MRTQSEIKTDLTELLNMEFYEGGFMDNFLTAIAKSEELIYEDIENAKVPYLYSKVLNHANNLEDLGQMYNMPREDGESDENYLYRLVNWKLISEAANQTAVQAAIINPEHASYMEFIPQTNGANTGSVYIIPNVYEEETIMNAINEAKEKVSKVLSPGTYIEYIVPDMTGISLDIKLEVKPELSEEMVQGAITTAIRNYTNNIAPNDYLVIGTINKIGISIEGVEYFNVMQMYINDVPTKSNKNLQSIDKKFILDEVAWS